MYQMQFVDYSSIAFEQKKLLKAIMALNKIDCFDVDLTYSTGAMWRGLPEPRLKFDLHAQANGAIFSDSQQIPLREWTVDSIMFDPPFVGPGGRDGLIPTRFGRFESLPDAWRMYDATLRECSRVLKPRGVLVFKCQDVVDSNLNWLSHIEIVNRGIAHGLYPRDLFVLLAKARMIAPNIKNPQHARKYHSFFLIFTKEKCRIPYTSNPWVPSYKPLEARPQFV